MARALVGNNSAREAIADEKVRRLPSHLFAQTNEPVRNPANRPLACAPHGAPLKIDTSSQIKANFDRGADRGFERDGLHDSGLLRWIRLAETVAVIRHRECAGGLGGNLQIFPGVVIDVSDERLRDVRHRPACHSEVKLPQIL